MLRAVIFDLDGVLTDTAHYHFLAWKKLGENFGFELTESMNENLKGVSRVDSLKAILGWANVELDDATFQMALHEKNEHYLTLVEGMDEQDLFEGIIPLLSALKENNIRIALGSASKNARLILKKLMIDQWFDFVGDGHSVEKGKPEPDLFLHVASALGVPPEDCLVVEDALAGIQAAIRANMASVGISKDEALKIADDCYEQTGDLNISILKDAYTNQKKQEVK